MLCLFDARLNRIETNSPGEVITGATVAELIANYQDWGGRPLTVSPTNPSQVYYTAPVAATAGEVGGVWFLEVRPYTPPINPNAYAKKQNSRNNRVLGRIRRQVNIDTYRAAAQLLNTEGDEAAVRYTVEAVYCTEAHAAYRVYFLTGAAPAQIIEAVRVLDPAAPFAPTAAPFLELLKVNAEETGINLFMQAVSVWGPGGRLISSAYVRCVGWRPADGLDALKKYLDVFAEAALKQYPQAVYIGAVRDNKHFAEWKPAVK